MMPEFDVPGSAQLTVERGDTDARAEPAATNNAACIPSATIRHHATNKLWAYSPKNRKSRAVRMKIHCISKTSPVASGW